MSDLTIRLVDGKDWVKIKPFGCEIGEVVAGTSFVPGDWVRRPEWLTWKQAANADHNGNTNVGPFDLDLVSDAVTGALLLPESDQEAVDRAAGGESAEEVFVDQELARLLDLVLQSARYQEASPRRRKTDLAA